MAAPYGARQQQYLAPGPGQDPSYYDAEHDHPDMIGAQRQLANTLSSRGDHVRSHSAGRSRCCGLLHARTESPTGPRSPACTH
jgi:hypothetical protein